ncbi:MAG: thioredoxin family protein [Giesbergeria sp.]
MPYTSQHLSAEPSREQVDQRVEPTLLEFGTPWCGHCQGAQPLIEQALARHPEVAHTKVEDGKGRPLGRSFAVKLWPTLVFLQGGQEVARLVRPPSAQAIDEALAKITR